MTTFTIFLIFSTSEGIYANPQPPTFEEKYIEAGYKSVKDAVNEFENHFNCEVLLPTILPSITFTHSFGKFVEDQENNMNDTLEIRFIHKDRRENIFKMDIRSIKHKLDFEGKKYTLHDGSNGIYFEHHPFNFFVFEKNNLQYLLGINIELSNAEMANTFVRIANSIE